MNETIGMVLLLLFVGMLLGCFAWAGWRLAHGSLRDRAQQVQDQEAELQAGWDALERTQRLNDGFWAARKMMRAEAMRYRQESGRS